MSVLSRHNEETARLWAVEAHGDQGYGSGPYAHHLDQVGRIVRSETDDIACLMTAYLHDVVEDTHVTIEQVRSAFGPAVADAVELLTDMPGKNWKERKVATYARLREASNWRAKVVKLADRIANLRQCRYDLESPSGDRERGRSLAKMYLNEHDAFMAAVSGVSSFLENLVIDLSVELDQRLDES